MVEEVSEIGYKQTEMLVILKIEAQKYQECGSIGKKCTHYSTGFYKKCSIQPLLGSGTS